MAFSLFIISFIVCVWSTTAYTIAFHSNAAGDNSIRNKATLKESPSAVQVADVLLRLNGQPPILREDTVQMPSSSVFTKVHSDPLRLIEIQGGSLPSYITPVLTSSSKSIVSGPNTKEISDILSQHGHKVEVVKVNGGDLQAIDAALKAETRPAVIVHSSESRKLDATTVKPLTEFQISEYQICLWTGLVLVVLVFSTIMATATMDTNFDNILYARFLSTRSNDKRA